MKKLIIGTLVGGIIIFVWSALSWVILPTHYNSYKFNPNQDAILQMLKDQNTESGVYALPAIDDRNIKHGTTEYQKAMEDMNKTSVGKPWAMLLYQQSYEGESGGTFAKGIFYDLIIAFAFCMVVSMAGAGSSFGTRFGLCLVIGLAFIARGPLTAMNWQGYPMHFFSGEIIDTVVETIFTGAFISWLYGRK